VKIADFHVQRNIELEITNSSKSKLVMKCKDSNCSWRMYATPNIIDIWEIKINPLEHSYFGSATRADHSQMTSRMIADIVKNRLRDNLEMTVKEAMGLVRQKFSTVQPSYNKLWRGRELTIADLFGSWERSYEILLSLLAAIQNFTDGTKYIIETAPSTKFGVENFNCVAWAFGPCIAAWPYLRPVLTIDAGFLSGRYAGKLFMACGYDAEQQLLSLAFVVVAGEESVANWGWFMQWLRKEVFGPGKISVISDQHLGIRAVFERPDFG
jgi:MULE transposase domain